MVWAGIFLNGRTDLIEIDGGSLTGVRYRDEVLRPVVVPLHVQLVKISFLCRITPVDISLVFPGQ